MDQAEPASNAPNACTQTKAVLSLALILRLLVLGIALRSYPAGWLYTRGIEMDLLARSLLAGSGLSSPFGPPTGPTAFIAPGYPLLIAATFRIFGSDSLASEIVIMTMQILASLITIWLVMHLARTLFNQRTALLAGLIWSTSIPLLWIPTIFWDTSLSILFLLGLFALVLHYEKRATSLVWLSLGAYCAVACLVNPALILALLAMLLWLNWRTRPSRSEMLRPTFTAKPLLAACAFALVFAPWPLRNAHVFHAFIPLRTTVGFELWMGNHPNSSGFLEEKLFPMFNPEELSQYRLQGEVAYTRNKAAAATQYIQDHPLAFARLTGLRIARFWLGSGTRGGSPLFAFHATLTSTFGLAALGLLQKRKRHALTALFALPLLLFPIPYYITHAEFRYRLVIDPLMTVLTAYMFPEIIQGLRSRSNLPPAPSTAQSGHRVVQEHSAASRSPQ